MNKFQIDKEFGDRNENEVLTILSQKFEGIEKIKRKYSPFNYKKTNLKIELKSRRVTSDHYKTTMISLTKLLNCYDIHTRYLFLFKFTDKLMWIEYNEGLFNEFEIKQGGRYDRKKGAEITTYCYIPIEYLKDIEDL